MNTGRRPNLANAHVSTEDRDISAREFFLKLTCHHINRRHFCFNIKSIFVHPLLWMNVMLDFICMVFAGM